MYGPFQLGAEATPNFSALLAFLPRYASKTVPLGRKTGATLVTDASQLVGLEPFKIGLEGPTRVRLYQWHTVI
jgi:hypothetical protein